ncbi:MAG: hemolysin III family protein [Spirochaetaceae bacterium]|jgi:hemolysin III|nr:hemolysin III family protein [Spirochaetaceae bacterium]
MNNQQNRKETLHNLVFGQTIPEEIANSITHGIGALLSIAAIVLLVVTSSGSGSPIKIFSFSVFGTTLFFLFISSTLLHSLRHHKAKAIFLKFDHIAIFYLIAGTYTPLMLVSIGGKLGWIMFIVVWSIALAGTLVKIFMLSASADKISVAIYLAMGWMAVLFIKVIVEKLPLPGMILLFTGGILYTVGTAFFITKKVPFSHGIWHLFVLAAAICHFFCVYLYV